MKRFHLSTLLLLTVLAGAFLGANYVERVSDPWEYKDTSILVRTHEQGWPLSWKEAHVPVYERHRDLVEWKETVTFEPVSINFVVGFAALALVGYVFEKIVRRKKGE